MNATYTRSDSKVEVTGDEARYYNLLMNTEFELKQSPWPIRFVFKIECPLATDFVGRNWQATLREQGFDEFRVHPHYLGDVRLLAARKAGEED